MFRDPRDVIRNRVEMKIDQAQMRANARVRGAGVRAARGAESKARGAVTGQKGGGAPVKKKKGWWPFGKKKAAPEAAGCGSCGKPVDDSWEMCPYCGNSLGGEPPQAQAPSPTPQPNPGAAAPAMPQVEGNRTVALDMSQLAAPKKSVVGWLVVMEGNQKGMDFRLYDGQNLIGAAADNDIVVTDEYLSAKHASIRFSDGRYELNDNDSTNGTFLNEKRVRREDLVDNDTIRLGRTHLRFKAIY